MFGQSLHSPLETPRHVQFASLQMFRGLYTFQKMVFDLTYAQQCQANWSAIRTHQIRTTLGIIATRVRAVQVHQDWNVTRTYVYNYLFVHGLFIGAGGSTGRKVGFLHLTLWREW